MSCRGLLRLAILLATILASVTVVLATDKEAATRIVDSKCLDYVNMVSTPHDIITLDLDSPVRQSYTLQCPLQNPYVVGGKAVQKDEFPHMVALGYVAPAFQRNNWKFQCGGTLISELFVLTAAHCINRDLRIARLGVVDVDDPDAQDFRIEKEIIHEEYSPATKYNDLALLRLDRNVSITLHLRPACLATDRAERNRRATVTGWGKTGRVSELSNVLNKVSLDVPEDRRACARMYSGPGKAKLVDSQICAGSLAGEQDACQGDSGGPLQVFDEDKCRYHLLGVVSYGKICGSAEYGVYTRVSRYLEWIVARVWPAEWARKEEWDY
ncbi:coagulation factor XI [Culex quinquefasciatus]|uniref:Coagulation factor XI n=1 Tax=Culex quinquefasciatus TaxID=7176 RepID=B0W6K1_CULQU|nr:coagulation factor XI [Culex quinquefasciatus]|eukprot:XP_001844335.1 coagulation factor XI [Culex quinquefasciatus]